MALSEFLKLNLSENSLLRKELSESVKGHMENKLDNLGSEGSAGPMLVHCSAGVGRTGTFIAIDMLMDKLRWFGLNTEIDIHSTVQHIRSYRMHMVQSFDQYEFIYKALKCHIQGLVIRNFPGETNTYQGDGIHRTNLNRNKHTVRNK